MQFGQGQRPGVILISGLPGVGKSMISRLLTARFERSARIESDVLQEFIVSGRVAPNELPREEAVEEIMRYAAEQTAGDDDFDRVGS